ncbi:ChlI component of cobalt chelatase involved in B12 biosynthesis / ChlD component of cobalt chelatase involved in B12 biosynthesis [[Actinomadura] parvosata subsp. kistnae]|uniref:VWA domain-containing protein n=1 Tax=[Actinomadura] parvosata TaxID=1955412 RepID=UPI000D27DFDE|nr:VWA domain-containing protein [Nonomuraea sp. ATCC 55076]SPL97969.1 ChlI component of cobalt chelatase involved in B12 biosynthesis / ChlD component of cobalt chelatase involved in B12 biosynthesis [Actinomadura parvosata subsp. kistnae]
MIVTYPFSAVVGLDDLKLALVLNAVSPRVGGVLVRGEKGTAKSTIVRALAAQLPAVEVVPGCRFACDPAAPAPECPDGPHDPGAEGVSRPAALVELPVGASEDRLVGSLDVERALTEGVKAFEPGLLAAAHRGVLYVDEVNLLHDHLIDLLLDAAALGTCYVERESVSVRHAARFLLVGTMNPEEGELRPQLLDRFGLTVEVKASRDPAERAEVVRRRLAFDADAEAFAARWAGAEAVLARRIAAARARVAQVRLPDARLRQIATVCAAFEVDGLRADLVTANAAVAHAAWQGRDRVTTEDVRAAARLSLPHRRRRDPFDAPGLDEALLEELLERTSGDDDDDPDGSGGPDGPGGPGGSGGPGGPGGSGGGSDRPSGTDSNSGTGTGGTAPGHPGDGHVSGDSPDDQTGGGRRGHSGDRRRPPPGSGAAAEGWRDGATPGAHHSSSADDEAERASHRNRCGTGPADLGMDGDGSAGAGVDGGAGVLRVAGVARPYRVPLLEVPGVGEGAAGRRSRARGSQGRGTGARRPSARVRDLHVAATLRAAAPYQRERGRGGPGLVLRGDDLREVVREGREGNLVLFVVDASGSMAARKRMTAVKTAVLSLLLDAYQRRDKVGLVTFRGAGAEVALPPTSSVEAGAARLRTLATGGRTPLAAGLARAAEVLRVERLRDPARRPLLVLVTDGRATSGGDVERAAALLAGTAAVVVDCESGPVRLGLAVRLAARLRARLVPLDSLTDLGSVVHDHRARVPRHDRRTRTPEHDHRAGVSRKVG